MTPASVQSSISGVPVPRNPSAASPPQNSAGLRDRIEATLTAFLAAHAHRLAEVGPDAVALTETLTRFVNSGGKRLRPVLCYWGWRGAGGDDDPGIIAAAGSLELLHTFALVHDDIMDASDTRRGRATVHREFSALHTDAQWHGSADLFGVGTAILLGDLCLILSDAMFHECGLAPEAVRTAQALLTTTRAELAAGQYLDLLAQARRGFSITTAAQVIRYKTAKYTVERPLQIGGRLADASPALIAAYSEFGIPLGEAFQLRDDLLGAFGDPAVTGKSIQDDFREGKPTWLIAATWEQATTTQRDRITALHGNPALDADGALELRDIITATGARTKVDDLIATRTAQALHALHQAPLAPVALGPLHDLAHAATTRAA